MHRHILALTVALTTSTAMAHEGHHHHASPQPAGHASSPASAHAAPLDGVSVQDCWIRNMPAGLPSGGYFVVRNSSAQAVELAGLSSPAYGMTMLHQTVTQDGMARMQHADSIEVPAAGELEFKPGGYHAMLEQPTLELAVGSKVPMTFIFGSAGQLVTECALRAPAATGY